MGNTSHQRTLQLVKPVVEACIKAALDRHLVPRVLLASIRPVVANLHASRVNQVNTNRAQEQRSALHVVLVRFKHLKGHSPVYHALQDSTAARNHHYAQAVCQAQSRTHWELPMGQAARCVQQDGSHPCLQWRARFALLVSTSVHRQHHAMCAALVRQCLVQIAVWSRQAA